MLIVSYDFSNDKTRARFAKFLEKYGRRLQYSVFEIRNSKRVLDNILTEIDKKYKKEFANTDSIVIIPITPADRKNVIRYGYAKHDEVEVVVFS